MRPRIRSVKPDIYHDEKLWELGVSTGMPVYQGFQGLWTYGDREGRFEWRPQALRSLILPYWSGDFEALLDALVGAGMVAKYRVGDRDYGLVVNLKKHQAPNAREPASTLPPPPRTCTHVHARAEHGGVGVGVGDGIGFGVGDDESASTIIVDEPEPASRPTPAPTSGPPQRHWQYPPDWAWSTETSARAAARGITPAELREHVTYWTTHVWGVGVSDLDGELQRSFDGIIERRGKASTMRPGAPPAADPYAWTPTQEHRAFADAHALPIAPAVLAYRTTGRPNRLGTLPANEDFMRRLKHWATHGEFVADGPLPVSRVAKGAA